jgi:hypothetical protein
MHRITLYTKSPCHLCENVRQDLDLLRLQHDCVITEVDITSDPDLYDRYRYLIPVVVIEGGPTLTAPIDLPLLRNALGLPS